MNAEKKAKNQNLQILKTSDVARQTGLSVNAIRLYEQLGYLPPVPRGKNGYRQFTTRHIRHVRLVQQAGKITWLGGRIRKMTQHLLKLAAEQKYQDALNYGREVHHLIESELEQSNKAIDVLEKWTVQQQLSGLYTNEGLHIGQVANLCNVTTDELRSWERNGLLHIPRAKNGYRVYGQREVDQILVIRALRRSRYSTMSILKLLQHLQQGRTDKLRKILDAPINDEDKAEHQTDSWLTSLDHALTAIQKLLDMLQTLH